MNYQIMYSSQATRAMSMSDLEDILAVARRENPRRNVTGVLIFVDDVFLQVLEGEKSTVVELMRSIERDSRHSLVKTFYEAETDSRTFVDWRMAYLDATPGQLAQWSGIAGSVSIEKILEELQRTPQRTPQLIEHTLLALSLEQA